MVVAEKKSFKVEIDGDVLEAVRAAFDRKKIGYWDGAEAVFRWVAAQDGMLQSLIFGQVDEAYVGQVARMVLARMAAQDGDPETAKLIIHESGVIAPADAPKKPPSRGGAKRRP